MKIEYSVNGDAKEELSIIEYGIDGDLLITPKELAKIAAGGIFRFVSMSDFPINIEIFINDKNEGLFKVEVEYKPTFTASKIE